MQSSNGWHSNDLEVVYLERLLACNHDGGVDKPNPGDGSRRSMTCYLMDPQYLCSVAVAIALRHDRHNPERNDARPADKTSRLQIGLSGQYQGDIPRPVGIGTSHAPYVMKGEQRSQELFSFRREACTAALTLEHRLRCAYIGLRLHDSTG